MGAATRIAELLCYVGMSSSNVPPDRQGIYVCRFDPNDGTLSTPVLAAASKGTGFVEVDPSGRFLFATQSDGVASFRIDRATGTLTHINTRDAGLGPTCHVSLDATAKVLLAANYNDGRQGSFHVADDGTISGPVSLFQNVGHGPNKGRQEKAHAHSFNVDPTNRFALSCDLGIDQILVYKINAQTGELTPNDPPFARITPGHGPRHLVFSTSGKLVYLLNELANTITTLTWDSGTGRLETIDDISTLPPDFTNQNTAAEVRVHPSGKFLYASNRGHDSIAIFSLDADTGKPKLINWQPSGGQNPRNIQIDPSGQYLIAAHDKSGDVVVFRIDESTGRLTPTGSKVLVPGGQCVRFVK